MGHPSRSGQMYLFHLHQYASRRTGHPASRSPAVPRALRFGSNARVCCAIINSSSVGMTKRTTRLSGPEISALQSVLDVAADRGYFSSEEILACEKTGIAVTLPKPMTSNSKADGRFGKQTSATWLRRTFTCVLPAKGSPQNLQDGRNSHQEHFQAETADKFRKMTRHGHAAEVEASVLPPERFCTTKTDNGPRYPLADLRLRGHLRRVRSRERRKYRS